MKYLLLAFGILCVSTLADAVLLSSNNSEGRLMEYIFTNYSPDIRPVVNDKEPVVVRFGLMLNQIIDLDVVNQILIVNVWIRMFWKSEMFKWDPDQFGGIKSINVEPSKMWVPDITVYNSASKTAVIESLYKKITSKIIIYHTGEMTWLSSAILTTSCKVDVRYFPFDSQRCLLEFGSWTYNGLKIDVQLHLDHVDTSDYKPNKEWHLEGAPAKRKVTLYSCCPEPYPSLKFYLIIKRRAMFYVFNLIIPCGLITLLSLFSFVLPPDSGERVSFVITVMLSLSVYMLLVTEKMPQASETPLASEFFMTMLVLVALSLVVTCFVIRFHNKKTPFPPILRKIFNQWLAWLMFMGRYSNKKGISQNGDAKKKKAFTHTNGGFLNDDTALKITRLVEFRSQNTADNYGEDNEKKDSNTNQDECMIKNPDELGKLLREVKFISDNFREIEAEENRRSEWIFFAEVLDRVFFLALLLSAVIASVSIFASTPSDSIFQ